MKNWVILFILTVLFLAVLARVYYETNVFKVSRAEFNSSKVPEGFEVKVLQISDVHNKVNDNNEELINTVKELNADIIVITGDLIDRKTDDFQNVFSLIEKMKRINEDIYYVSGNHEWGNPYMEQLLSGLKERNVTILNNNNTQVTKKGITLNLLGVDDVSTGHEDLKKAFNNIDQEELYTILLSHSPDIIEKYNNIPADLILSGHTHGGQVRFPFIGALVVPDQGFFPKLDKGAYKVGTEQYLYIDSGLGTSIAPIRFLNQSQISLIKIANN